MGAMTAGTSATGARAWLATWAPSWLTPRRLRVVTNVLLTAAFVLSATVLSGSG